MTMASYAKNVAEAHLYLTEASMHIRTAAADVFLYADDGVLGAWSRADDYLNRTGACLARAEVCIARAKRAISSAVEPYQSDERWLGVLAADRTVARHFTSEVQRIDAKLAKLHREMDSYRAEIGWEAP